MIDEDQQSRESRDLSPSFEILNGPLRKVFEAQTRGYFGIAKGYDETSGNNNGNKDA